MNRMSSIYLLSFALCISSLQAKIIQITDENGYTEALKQNDRLVVEFAADWCSVCNNIKKPFEEVANEDEFGKVAFAHVNVDKLDSISKQNGVVGVPTFVYLEKGAKKTEDIGVQNLSAFKEHLRDSIRKTFLIAQNESGETSINQPQPTMADITSQDTTPTGEETQPTAPTIPEEPNFFVRILNAVQEFFVLVVYKIKEFFVMIFDAIKGLFGK